MDYKSIALPLSEYLGVHLPAIGRNQPRIGILSHSVLPARPPGHVFWGPGPGSNKRLRVDYRYALILPYLHNESFRYYPNRKDHSSGKPDTKPKLKPTELEAPQNAELSCHESCGGFHLGHNLVVQSTQVVEATKGYPPGSPP